MNRLEKRYSSWDLKHKSINLQIDIQNVTLIWTRKYDGSRALVRKVMNAKKCNKRRREKSWGKWGEKARKLFRIDQDNKKFVDKTLISNALVEA